MALTDNEKLLITKVTIAACKALSGQQAEEFMQKMRTNDDFARQQIYSNKIEMMNQAISIIEQAQEASKNAQSVIDALNAIG